MVAVEAAVADRAVPSAAAVLLVAVFLAAAIEAAAAAEAVAAFSAAAGEAAGGAVSTHSPEVLMTVVTILLLEVESQGADLAPAGSPVGVVADS